MKAEIQFKLIWMLFAMVLSGPFVSHADENWPPPLPRPSSSGSRELLNCSLQVTNAYKEGFRKRTWVNIKNQPVILGKSENALDLQPVFEGPALEAIYKNGIVFMASLYNNNDGQLRIKLGMYRTRKNLQKFTSDQYYLIPNSIFYLHPNVEQESSFEAGDEYSLVFNRAVGVHTNATYTVMNCQHRKSLNGGVK